MSLPNHFHTLLYLKALEDFKLSSRHGNQENPSLTVRRAIWKPPGKDLWPFPAADQVDTAVWKFLSSCKLHIQGFGFLCFLFCSRIPKRSREIFILGYPIHFRKIHFHRHTKLQVSSSLNFLIRFFPTGSPASTAIFGSQKALALQLILPNAQAPL